MRKDEYARISRLSPTHFWYVGTRDFLQKTIGRYKNGKNLKLLDAGCGPGAMYKALKTFGKVYGVDQSREALYFCKKIGLEAKKGNIEKLSFPNNFFDIVVCTEVLYHKNVKNLNKAVNELFRVLKPDGLIICREPSFPFLYRSHDKVVETGRRFKLSNFKNLFQNSGFTVVNCGYTNLMTFFIILIKKTIEWLKKREYGSDVQELPKVLNYLFLLIIKIENRILGYSSLPIGSSVFFIGKK